MDFLRREYDRIPLKSKLVITTVKNKVHLADCINLSMGGMRFSVFKDTPEFRFGTLNLSYNNKSDMLSLKTSFTVQWRTPSLDHIDLDDIGVMFSSVTDNSRLNLVQILISLMKEESEEIEF